MNMVYSWFGLGIYSMYACDWEGIFSKKHPYHYLQLTGRLPKASSGYFECPTGSVIDPFDDTCNVKSA